MSFVHYSRQGDIYCERRLVMNRVRDVQVVRAGEEEDAGGRSLRHPPGVAEKTTLTALHAPRGEIEHQGANLDRTVDPRRMREGAHQRVGFRSASRDGEAR